MSQEKTTETIDSPGTTETDGHDTSVWECTDCRERWYYDRALCPNCGAGSADTADLGAGHLVATTTARVTPPGVRGENPLGLATFANDVNVLAQLPAEETRRPAVGDTVCLVGHEQLRDGVEGPRLRLTEEAHTANSSRMSASLPGVSE